MSVAPSFPYVEQDKRAAVLGEQVREAVELLLNEVNRTVRSDPTLLERVRLSPGPGGLELSEKRVLEALYQAAVRIIMRLVIILFAEAREMLPRSLVAYSTTYGLEGLYEQLRDAEQSERRGVLERRFAAWTRILNLFTLVYHGSTALDMAVRKYSGLLFRSGEQTSMDATLRALTIFESLEVEISDRAVLLLLACLKTSRVRIGRGRGSRVVVGAVDFSMLRTEYIGLMYQGLLDFNLHATDEALVFLNLGQEPVLPLGVLEHMSDQHLKALLEKLDAEMSYVPMVDGGEENVDTEALSGANVQRSSCGEEVEEAAELRSGTEDDEAEEGECSGERLEMSHCRQRALLWAERAVEVVGLLKTQRSGREELYVGERKRRAHKLIKRVLDQREFYLVRRGGTRKGSGTFYTRPQLSVPMTRRTLEPLLYVTLNNGICVPRKPEEILSLKVCDPACGSASFLVAALHSMTDALFQSILYHGRVRDLGQAGTAIVLRVPVKNEQSRDFPEEEHLKERPTHERFAERVRARLRRSVVEHCLYGVDLSPLAVELARLSLWMETFDHELPFLFLDHKIKVGNALVGGWFETFRGYPIMAWMRDGGDASHKNGVRYAPKEWTDALSTLRNGTIKGELIGQIESDCPQSSLFGQERQQTPEELHHAMASEMERIHALSLELTDEREIRYRAWQRSSAYRTLKRAFDSWCAVWFWPADELDRVPTPATFHQLAPTTQTRVDELAAKLHFFHWEIEFPEVFVRSEPGFDAILANPPWETAKASSKEFFSEYDLLYRTYGKQDALQKQSQLFEKDPHIERDWLLYQAYFKNLSNWTRHVASPFGDPLTNAEEAYMLKPGKHNAELHATWRRRRERYVSLANETVPFRYQGVADLNTYKMFLEISHYLLKKGGQMGILVPSGIYSDQGSMMLRKLLLEQSRWHWLFGFINTKHIFDIDSRCKFAVILLEKGRHTEAIRVVFNQRDLAHLAQAEAFMLDLPRKQVERFSPKSLVIVEAQTARDEAILEKLYTNTVLLGDQGTAGWRVQYAREFDMTNDSTLFPPLSQWEAQGYRPDIYGCWSNEQGNRALPLYEGRMIGFFDPSKKGWIRGKGRKALWSLSPFEKKVFGPQYLMAFDTYAQRTWGNRFRGNKIGFMGVGSATNARSMYTTLIADMPCGNAVPVLQSMGGSLLESIALVACLNSFVYDYALRCRLGGVNLNYFVIAETPVLPPGCVRATICALLAARLNLIMPNFAPQWLEMRTAYPALGERHWRELWAITEHERLRLRCILDAIVAELYGLEYADFAWILRDDPHNPKGFWRVDKEKPCELRQTTLTLTAFKRLKEVGLEAFSQEDWQFSQEIGAQLGPRFTSWQAEGTVEESWRECEEHARNVIFAQER